MRYTMYLVGMYIYCKKWYTDLPMSRQSFNFACGLLMRQFGLWRRDTGRSNHLLHFTLNLLYTLLDRSRYSSVQTLRTDNTVCSFRVSRSAWAWARDYFTRAHKRMPVEPHRMCAVRDTGHSIFVTTMQNLSIGVSFCDSTSTFWMKRALFPSAF